MTPFCETIRVGGRRCSDKAAFLVHRSTPVKPQWCCTTHALQVLEDDIGSTLTPIDDVPLHNNKPPPKRCDRWTKSDDGSISRCTSFAEFRIVDPDGKRVPGNGECTFHAVEVITEYNTKLNEGTWSLEAIE